MSRQASVSVENSFVKGLITEATALNFPENACTETDNCRFEFTGEVSRRLGIDLEEGAEEGSSSDVSNAAITEFLWRAVSLNGEISFLVVQIGTTINFYAIDADGVASPSLKNFTLDLAAEATTTGDLIASTHASFASGNGQLFVVHPYCTPVYIEYDSTTDTIDVTSIDIKIRDMKGLPNTPTGSSTPLAVDVRPTTLSGNILYNLLNQGWDGFKEFTIDRSVFGGQNLLRVWRQGGDLFGTSGAAAAVITSKYPHGRSDWPSEADFPTVFRAPGIPTVNSDGNVIKPSPPLFAFCLDETDSKDLGNAPAPKGHYIYNATYVDRWSKISTSDAFFLYPEAFAGLNSLEVESSGFHRPSQVAFFAGRVWYAGIDSPKYNNKIYFSKIIEGNAHIDECYQQQDPTSADAASTDLLPSDGGIVIIPDIASVVKLVPYGSSLLVFATNGIWQISGSAQGAGFTATDYGIIKLSSIGAITPLSFVDAEGTPIWCNADGIFSIKQDNVGPPQIVPLSLTTISTFYDTIPVVNRRFIKGCYNKSSKIVQWLFKSEEATTVKERYEYDRILNLDLVTGSFYPWSVPIDNVYICGLTTLEGFGSVAGQETVTDDEVDVTDSSTDVTEFGTVLTDIATRFKYLVLATGTTPVTSQTMTVADATIYNDTLYFATGIFGHVTSNDNNSQIIPTAFTDYPWYTDSFNLFSDKVAGSTYGNGQILQYGGFLYILEYNYDDVGQTSTGKPSVRVHRYNTVDGAKTYTDILVTESHGGFDKFRGARTGYIKDGYLYISFDDDNIADASNLDGELRKYLLSDMSQVASVSSVAISTGSGNPGLDAIQIGGSDATYIWGTATGDSVGRFVVWRCTLDLVTWQICKTTLNYNVIKDGVISGQVFLSEDGSLGSRRHRIARLATASFSSGGATDTGLTTYDVDNVLASSNLMGRIQGYSVGAMVDASYLWTLVWTGNPAPIQLVRFDKTDFSSYTLYDISSPVSGVDGDPVDNANLIDHLLLDSRGLIQDTDNLYLWVSDNGGTGIIKIAKATPGSTVMYDNSNLWDEFTTDDLTSTTRSMVFADERDTAYVDWFSVDDVGEDYSSYFVSGYKLRGEAIRKFQSNYMQIYTRNTVPSVFDINTRWDYAIAGTGGRWGSIQRLTQELTMNDTSYAFATKRIKTRGHGKALNFMVSSVTGEPFNIVGWSLYETANSTP